MLDWNPNWDTGIPIIDQQHRQLLQALNKVTVFAEHSAPKVEVEQAFLSLVKLVQEHCKTEEALMEAVKYKAIIDHKLEHVFIIKRVRDYYDAYVQFQEKSVLENTVTLIQAHFSSGIEENLIKALKIFRYGANSDSILES